MLGKHWQAQLATLAILTIKSAASLSVLTSLKAFAITPPSHSVVLISQCTSTRIKSYIQQLSQEDKAESAFSELVKCNSSSVPELIKALKNKDRHVKIVTIATLGSIGSNAVSAIPSLNQTSKDKDKDVRAAALDALAKIRNPIKDSVPTLIAALKNQDANARLRAAKGLERVGTPVAIPALKQALRDKYASVRSSAATALGNIGTPAKDAVPELIALIDDEKREVRDSAIFALGEIGIEAKQAIPVLLGKTASSSIFDYSFAFNILDKICENQVFRCISQYLEDGDTYVQSGAILFLGEFRKQKESDTIERDFIVEQLISIIQNYSDVEIRYQAIKSLEKVLNRNELYNLYSLVPSLYKLKESTESEVYGMSIEGVSKGFPNTRKLWKDNIRVRKKPIICKIPVLNNFFSSQCR